MTAASLHDADLEACRAAIRTGSLSFHAASRLLPARVRDPALVLYAFCRLADDAVDLGRDKLGAVNRLNDRLDRVYRGAPRNAPADRAFAAVVERFEMPAALPAALIEGLAWDAEGRRYADPAALQGYAARVAASVGAMMCVLMGVRDPHALARACDLGVAMQLTNIARDVGEDARAGRLYLPTDWLTEMGVAPDLFLADPLPSTEIRLLVKRLLLAADRLYRRSEAGVPALPFAARPGIYAARHIYDGIGGAIRRNGHDSVSWRSRTSKRQKAGWLGLSLARAAVSGVTPRSSVLYARPLPETAFLVEAAAHRLPRRAEERADSLVGVFAQLAARDDGALRSGPGLPGA